MADTQPRARNKGGKCQSQHEGQRTPATGRRSGPARAGMGRRQQGGKRAYEAG